MAIVGEASIVVRAITTGVKGDIKKAFDGVDADASNAGGRAGNSFRKGFAGGGGGGGKGLFGSSFFADADAASKRFTSLARANFALQPALTGVAGAIGALGSGLVSLVGILGAAAPGAVALGTSLSALAQGAITAKLAFSGVANAIKAGTKINNAAGKNTKAVADANLRIERAKQKLATLSLEVNYRLQEARLDALLSTENLKDAQYQYNDALRDANEELQQTRFSVEEAALDQVGAALALARARDNLAKTSDLPASSRARQQAVLELQQADLKYRQAVDKNNDAREAGAKAIQVKEREITNAKRQLDAAKRQDAETQRQVDPNAISSQAYDDEKALASARQEIVDAQKALNEATKGGAAANQAYSNALSGLSKEAQSFVKYIVSIQGEFKKLRAAAGQNLFPELEIAIQNLVDNLFPRLIPLLRGTGGVLGKIAKEFSNTITEADNLKKLEAVWKTNDTALASFGKAGSNLYTTLLNIAAAAEPITLRFSKWIETLTKSWKETTTVDEKTGELTKKFNVAGNILKDLGTIFGNVFGAFGQIIKANVGKGSGGQILLDYFKDATERFKQLLTAGNEDGSLRTFFADAAKNATKILSLLGNIIGEFVKLGGTEGTGKFIDSLNTVVDIFGEIGQNISDTGALETFGAFLVSAATTVKNFTEGGAVTAFFSTLKTALDGLNKVLENPGVKDFLTSAGRIFAIASALGLIGTAVSFIAKVAIMKLIVVPLRALSFLLTSMKYGVGPLTAIRTALTPLAASAGLALGPFLAIAAAIAVVIAAFVLMYKNSETLRTSLSTLFGDTLAALGEAFAEIREAIEDVLPAGMGLSDVFKTMGDFVGKYIVPVLGVVFTTVIQTISSLISGLIKIVGGFIKVISGDFSGVKDIFEGFLSFIKIFLNNIVAVFRIVDIFGGLSVGFKKELNKIIKAWNDFGFSLSIGGKTFRVDTPNIKYFSTGELKEYVQPNKFAMGGTVFPQPGGVLATIAEAGRAERIEPLDPDGLSKRDKAMIQLLSGGAGSGVTVNVYPSPGMNERELASVVSRQLALQFRTGAA